MSIYANTLFAYPIDSLVFYDLDYHENRIYLYIDVMGRYDTSIHGMQKFSISLPQLIKDLNTDAKNVIFKFSDIMPQDKIASSQLNSGIEKLNFVIEKIKILIEESILSSAYKSEYASFDACQTAFASKEYSNQFAYKLFPDRFILATYVSYCGKTRYDFDNTGFKASTGYTTKFDINIFYEEDNNVMHYRAICVLPFYRNEEGSEFYYESFLNGVETLEGSGRYRYQLKKEVSEVICEKSGYLNDPMKYGGIFKSNDYTYMVYDNTAYIVNYHGDTNITKLVIPNKIDNYSVVGICCSFYETSIQEIILPNTLRIIGQSFNVGKSCLHIVFGENVEFIGGYAFKKSVIEEIEIKQMLYIGQHAFEGVSSLKIIYHGTIDQWNNTYMSKQFDAVLNTYIVECSDGTLTKE